MCSPYGVLATGTSRIEPDRSLVVPRESPTSYRRGCWLCVALLWFASLPSENPLEVGVGGPLVAGTLLSPFSRRRSTAVSLTILQDPLAFYRAE